MCTLVDEITKEVLCQHFPATRVTAYMSSTAFTQAFHRHVSVVASSVSDSPAIKPMALHLMRCTGFLTRE